MTIKMNVRTDQTAFNEVARHLLNPDTRQAHDSGTCLYLTPKGERCAVGILMKGEDEAIKACNAFGSVGGLMKAKCDVSFGRLDTGLLADLQGVHDHGGHWKSDRSPNIEQMAQKLLEIADLYDLDTKAVK